MKRGWGSTRPYLSLLADDFKMVWSIDWSGQLSEI